MMTPNYRAQLCLFPENQGGRDNPFRSNKIRLDVVFPHEETKLHYGAEIIAEGKEYIGLGEIDRKSVV